MKIAIVHDWITVVAGSESCLKIMAEIYPEADIFTLVSNEDSLKKLNIAPDRVTNSVIQKFPMAQKKWKSYLPFFPYAIEQIDLSSYDVIISSSHAVAKGVLVKADQVHICYIYSPIRYVWDLYHQYLNEANLKKGIKGFIVKLMLHKIRKWDVTTSNRVDEFIPISHYIEKRVWRTYRRKSFDVIYPPVSVDDFTLELKKEDFYLTASRLVPYKKVDLIVEAFSEMTNKKLIVIGDGPELKKIKSIATPNISVLGYQEFEILKSYMQRAKAFIFVAEEDFGIIPIEAQACGTPVIAYGKGGSLETVKGKFINETINDSDTGVFMRVQTKEEIINTVDYFEKHQGVFNSNKIREFSLSFDVKIFKSKIKKSFTKVIEKYSK
jgi:glycosyltransferase involved in cell wall biosynthesis